MKWPRKFKSKRYLCSLVHLVNKENSPEVEGEAGIPSAQEPGGAPGAQAGKPCRPPRLQPRGAEAEAQTGAQVAEWGKALGCPIPN